MGDAEMSLVEQVRRGTLTRRDLVRSGMALGLPLPVIGAMLAACGGDEAAPPAEPPPAEPPPAEPPPAEPPPAEPPPAEPPPAEVGPVTAQSTATSTAMIELARQFEGSTINFQVEAGLQALVWKQDVKPQWEQLTGTTLNVVEVPFTEQFQKLVAAAQAPGTIDCAYVFYNWLPDLVAGQALAPFDDFFGRHLNTPELQAELADFIPAGIVAVSSWDGRQWGFPLDAAGLINFYRTDVFGDLGLQPPSTWQEYGDVAKAITDALAPDVYGALHPAGGGQAYFWFFQAYNSSEFGNAEYFDDNMDAIINGPQGVAALEALRAFLAYGPPGAETLDPGRPWTDFIEGKLGMMVNFSPFARWGSPGDEGFSEALSFVPQSVVEGLFDLTIPPGGNSDVIGYTTAISSTSEVQDLAFAFLAWATSPDVYPTIVAPPYSLSKPTRVSTFEALKGLWANSEQHLDTLQSTLAVLSMEPKWHAAQEYILAVDQACTSAYTGTDVQAALDEAAARWNELTDRVGRETQQAAYAAYRDQVAQLRSA